MFNSHLFHRVDRAISFSFSFCLATILILGASFTTPACKAQVTEGQIVPGLASGPLPHGKLHCGA